MLGPRRAPAIISRYGFLATLIAIDGMVLALVLREPAVVYSIGVSELLADSGKWRAGRVVRVEGVLASGSLAKRRSECEYRFRLKARDGASIAVRYLAESSADGQCLVPDTLCDMPGIELSLNAEGRLERSPSGPLFVAHAVIAKCPSKYEYADPDSRAAKAFQCPPIRTIP